MNILRFSCLSAAIFMLLPVGRLCSQDRKAIDSLYRLFHGENDLKVRANLLYAIADEQDNAGNPDEGFRYADSIELLAQAANYRKGMAYAFDIRGWAWHNKGHHTEALALFHRELDIFNQLNDLEGQGRTFNNIASCWHEMAVQDSSIVYKLKSLTVRERIGKPGDIAAALSNIGNTYVDVQAYDKGIEMLRRALRIRRQLGEEKRSMYTHNNLAVAYGKKGDFEKSVAHADTGIAIALKYNNKMVAGVISGGMGHVLNQQKRYQESIQWCERSLKYLKEANREANMVFPLCNMAEAYIGLGRYAKGLEVNQEGWALMQKLHLQDPLDPYHKNFANAYEGLKDYANAYKWHKIYFTRIDTTTQNDYLSKIANIEARYNLAKKQQELSEQKAANFRQKTILYGLCVALIGLIAFGWLFYNRFRLRKQAELHAAIIREQRAGLNAVIEAQEAERSRIAKDLHDGIAQELVALKLGFSALERRVSEKLPEVKPRFSELDQQLDISCTELRSIAHLMSPPILTQKGLAPSLEWLLRSTLQPAGIAAEFDCGTLPDNLPDKVKTGIYRITQELLNNIVRHAGASLVRLQLNQQANALVMRVEDNGKGYDFEKAKQQGSMGLLNIRSRVSTLDGTFSVNTLQPHGSAAVVQIML